MSTKKLSAKQLYNELETFLQLHKEAKLELLRTRVTGSIKLEEDTSNGYFGEAQYTHHPSTVRDCNRDMSTQRSSTSKIFTGCFLGHFARNFPRYLTLANATRGHLDSIKSRKEIQSIHSVLAKICYQLEEEHRDRKDDELTVFKEMLVSVPFSNSACRETDQCLDEPTVHGDINVVHNVLEYHEPHGFNGACVDSGAEKTVIGMPKTKLYCKLSGTHFVRLKSNRLYRFGCKKY